MDTVDSLLERLDQLHQVGVSLSQQRDTSLLLESILLAAKSITHADGGTLYRMVDDQLLRFEMLRTDSLGLAMGGSSGQPVTLPDLPLQREDGTPNVSLVAAYAAIQRTTVNIADVAAETAFDFSGTRQFDARTGYRSRSFLTVPMMDHQGEVIGVLQLINATDPVSHAVRAFSKSDQRLAESLASQAAIALTNRLLINQLEELFESFIGLINLAIDEKSPHTGGHCQRVPQLTLMLAEAVNATTSGPLADFKLDARDLYELKIAGMLHDCGKVTTPVHVVDKATKLQTLFDRIALIDTRFEVLRRDREIDCLRQQLALRPPSNAAAEAQLSAHLHDSLAQLAQDQALIHAVNPGREAMHDDELARVRQISERHRWRGPDGVETDFLTPDELDNLTIRAGTLTAAERGIINHHIVATIKLLEQLPWPRHLSRVAEFAGGHHERMDGKGYPRGLTRAQMSVPARMMGIADIFEALTASDRPYKSSMKLSQAMAILHKFKRNGHIDPDLFDVFVQQQVYLQYAHAFLDPAQIDEVRPQDWQD